MFTFSKLSPNIFLVVSIKVQIKFIYWDWLICLLNLFQPVGLSSSPNNVFIEDQIISMMFSTVWLLPTRPLWWSRVSLPSVFPVNGIREECISRGESRSPAREVRTDKEWKMSVKFSNVESWLNLERAVSGKSQARVMVEVGESGQWRDRDSAGLVGRCWQELDDVMWGLSFCPILLLPARSLSVMGSQQQWASWDHEEGPSPRDLSYWWCHHSFWILLYMRKMKPCMFSAAEDDLYLRVVSYNLLLMTFCRLVEDRTQELHLFL